VWIHTYKHTRGCSRCIHHIKKKAQGQPRTVPLERNKVEGREEDKELEGNQDVCVWGRGGGKGEIEGVALSVTLRR
jgi:hypothetical protein